MNNVCANLLAAMFRRREKSERKLLLAAGWAPCGRTYVPTWTQWWGKMIDNAPVVVTQPEALMMTSLSSESKIKYLSAAAIRHTGILQEVNRQFFHPLGLAAEVDMATGNLRIQDHRYDPSGVIFGPDVMEVEKYERFFILQHGRHCSRVVSLGYIKQPPPKTK